ncbi:hypothetical protein CEQ90_11910 [Lewinellaceae bacterium SD302]|nr:hypothetical protein CEQ90_11910 [Lewinellaceae bacterium SD302]
MLDALLDGLKGQVTSTIAEKTGLDLGQAEKALPVAKDSIVDGVMGAVSGGNVGGVLDMLKGATGGGEGVSGLMQNMVYKSIAGNFINKATSALGIPESMATTVSSLALPMILNKIGGAAQEAGDTDEIDQGSVMSALGLDAGGLMGKAKDLLGGGGLGSLLG